MTAAASDRRTASRGAAIALVLATAALLVGGCAGNSYPDSPPDPRKPNLTYAEQYYIKQMKYRQLTNDRLR